MSGAKDRRPPVVAIDGPGGAGKSTIASRLAAELGVAHIDTGAIYRAAALAVLRQGLDPSDGRACAAAAAQAVIERRNGRTILDGADVEDEIRGRRVTAVVSEVSGHPQVRAALLQAQREGLAHGAVVEGRDAGTAVVPDAEVKIWLTASAEERARRRAAQLGDDDPSVRQRLAEELDRRDQSDAERMRPAEGAAVVDTTGLSVDEVVATLLQTVRAGAR